MTAARRIVRYRLRTTDAAGARSFYSALLGDSGHDIDELPAQARARGAVPHWLGLIGVEDAERTADAFVGRGAVRLGPTLVAPRGGRVVTLRDPGGAVVALADGDVGAPAADE